MNQDNTRLKMKQTFTSGAIVLIMAFTCLFSALIAGIGGYLGMPEKAIVAFGVLALGSALYGYIEHQDYKYIMEKMKEGEG